VKTIVTHKAEHVDERREGRDDETVPALVALIEKGVHSVDRKARYCNIGNITES